MSESHFWTYKTRKNGENRERASCSFPYVFGLPKNLSSGTYLGICLDIEHYLGNETFYPVSFPEILPSLDPSLL
jgi:hypothetical protein